jgi:hypothetical protein
MLLMIITLLPLRDIVVVGHTCRHLRAIAEDERKKRLDMDIDRLLLRYVDDPDHFRCLMRDTGGIIVGDFARAFFTGKDTPIVLDLLFPPRVPLDIHPCLDSWISIIRNLGEIQSFVQKVNCVGRWTEEVGAFLYVP